MPRGRTVLGFALAGLIGLAVGFYVYLAVNALLLPHRLIFDGTVMWAVMLVVAVPFALAGGWAAEGSSLAARTAWKALSGFIAGGLAGAALVYAFSTPMAGLLGLWQGEGSHAMDTLFLYMPLGALIGGIAVAARAVVRERGARPPDLM